MTYTPTSRDILRTENELLRLVKEAEKTHMVGLEYDRENFLAWDLPDEILKGFVQDFFQRLSIEQQVDYTKIICDARLPRDSVVELTNKIRNNLSAVFNYRSPLEEELDRFEALNSDNKTKNYPFDTGLDNRFEEELNKKAVFKDNEEIRISLLIKISCIYSEKKGPFKQQMQHCHA